MILVLKRGTTQEQIRDVLEECGRRGLRCRVLHGPEKPLVHVVSGDTRAARALLRHERVQALVPTSGPRRRRHGRRFYPYHFINWCCVCLLLSGLLVSLSGFLPPGLGTPVELGSPPPAVELPWYLRALDRFLDLVPGAGGWLLAALVVALLFLLPALDRTRGPMLRGRAPVLALGLLYAAFVLWLALGGPAA